ncbi:MAG TPA: alpha/beta hydrolase [Gammaproteobacteria bacterium]|nr:alpha/beta hydrolase [Gammaproteobacteria bacterium]
MPLDPQCAALCEAAASAGAPFDAGDPLAVRHAYAATTAIHAYDPGPLKAVEDRVIDGPGGALALRVYRPHSAHTVLPALVYFHGGGWVVGDLDTHDHLCRHLAFAGDVVVLAVDYRLAPEHAFPAAVDDCVAAFRWACANASGLGIDATRIAVGGDSAGGNLAAVVCLAARDAGEPLPAFQLLIYPAVDFTADNASLRDNATGYLLTRAALRQFYAWYLGAIEDRRDWRVSPLWAASHAGLPPALVQTAEFDPLRDEGALYADTLRAARVPVEHRHYEGMVHGFARMGGKVDRGRRALDDAAAALRRALTR